ncbi:MAG: argininosuccinate lyase [Candidatus Altiarchaeota archaeon]|nr:argininosuccinate lyase [Candidatus Altiarchaeota archaeon]
MLRKRFSREVSELMKDFSSSIEADKEMLLDDIWGSQAHVIMLSKQGIIECKDAKNILKALETLREYCIQGRFELDPALEDVHMNLERFVVKEVGENVGGRMHTARSRNDQVVTDTRMKLRVHILGIEESLFDLEKTLIRIAEKSTEKIMPGYTHTQQAQPITLAYWATAYVSMLSRDAKRLKNSYISVNKSPLGACALAGTSFQTDRRFTAKLLGFDDTVEHALDAVSSRDFIVETLAALSILMSNLSRLSGELILYSTIEYGIVEPGEGYTTGSSIMPQKKNPDAAELVRGLTGHVYGALIQSLTILKSLPLGYNRDLQEDRVLLWNCLKRVNTALQVLAGMLSSSKFKEDRMLELAGRGFSTATELANYLTEEGMPFRKAHELTSRVVGELHRKGRDFRDFEHTMGVLEKHRIKVDGRVLKDILDPGRAVERSRSLGCTSPNEVKRLIKAFRRGMTESESDLRKRKNKLKKAREHTDKLIRELLG